MCKVGVVKGKGLLEYSFPPPHPFNSTRVTRFWKDLDSLRLGETSLRAEKAGVETTELFQEKAHIESVREASALGYGYLDEGDTPVFPGIFEATQIVVGSTLNCVENVLVGRIDHGVNPVGGLHHARPDKSAGFCVFNDIGVAIELLRKKGFKRILYVDIDVHHGDGVFYPYEQDPGVFIFDVHEDGRFLYPGTGRPDETGIGKGKGTKVNIALRPGDGDEQLPTILPKLEEFAMKAKPEFIIFQCGADGLAGDPIGGLAYTPTFHGKIAECLHKSAHQFSEGRIVALGGGGYNPRNCGSAWTSVTRKLFSSENT